MLEYKPISKNIQWNEKLCKFCDICIMMCPAKTLELRHGRMIEKGKCTRCFTCEKYCPDFAIEVIEDEKTGSRK